MFNRIVSRIKAAKTLKFSLEGLRFQPTDLSYKLVPKQIRFPSIDLTKIAEFIHSRLSRLPNVRITFNGSQILEVLKARRQQIGKYANKKTFTSSFVFSLGLYYAYEYNPFRTKVMLSYADTASNNKLVSSLSYLYNVRFYPTLIGPGAFMQALMTNLPAESAVHYTREPVILPDGGQIMLDWSLPAKRVEYQGTPLHGRYYPCQASNDNKIMFILHGLTGGSETSYIHTLVESARRNGYRVVVMNQRGVNQQLATPFPFHGGNLDDLEAGLAHVRRKYPNAPIVTVGTSFGGNQLMRYLGQDGDRTNIVGGILLAAPFDINDCVESIQNTVYEKFFIENYLEYNFLPNMDMFHSLKESHGVDMEQILRVKTLRDYHTHFTVKLFEHKNVGEYFSTTKVTESHVNNVKVPLLVLHARDDPIAVHKSIPIDSLKKNPNIIYAETSHGGHLGWFTGLKPTRVRFFR